VWGLCRQPPHEFQDFTIVANDTARHSTARNAAEGLVQRVRDALPWTPAEEPARLNLQDCVGTVPENVARIAGEIASKFSDAFAHDVAA
jgi:hypothetical protein